MNDTGQHNRDIKEAVQKLAGTFLKDNLRIIQAKVNCVHIKTYTCDCTPISGDNTTDINGVNLSANNNKGFIPIPAVCSTVLIAVSTKNNPPYLIGWDLLQGLICVIQNKNAPVSQLLIQNGTIQLNDGSLGGIPVNEKILENLNAVMSYVNTQFNLIATALSNLSQPNGTLIAANITNMQTQMADNEAPVEDMQNTKINHGV